MKLSQDVCYKAIKSRDSRFDGLFYNAVKTTGIYCRPICKVTTPRKENCTFYETAEEAEANGFRPCLRCRPEMAPEYSEFMQGKNLFAEIKDYFHEENYKSGLVKESAEYFGISTRHISRIFKENIGVSPQQYIMTKRLLKAKYLLTDTDLSVSEIAYLSGFGSSSRFSDAFKKNYGVTPGKVSRSKKNKGTKDYLEVKLFYRPPYDWERILGFFRTRQIPGVEHVSDEGLYRRSLRIVKTGNSGWIEISNIDDDNYLKLKISRSLEKDIIDVVKITRRVFDLDLLPDQMSSELPLGIRLPGCFDIFEMGTRAILGQQITVKAARTLTGRLVEALGEKIETPFEEINYHFPTSGSLVELGERVYDVLGTIGIIRNRSRSIQDFASLLEDDDIQVSYGLDPEEFKKKLISIKGIGEWTAEYLVMRGLSWPDAFPVTDLGVKKAVMPYLLDDDGNNLNDLIDNYSKYKFDKLYKKSATEYSKKYSPWRSYLTISLWT